jgi:uncharacterized protein YndB with AHSA1/START domain
MKWFLLILCILVCLVLIIVIIGYLLPVKHTASIQVSVPASPAETWTRLTDVKAYPAWRKEVRSVNVRSPLEWVEVNDRGDSLPLKIVAQDPGQRLVTEIRGPGLPFGGSWEFRLKDNGASTLVTITEHGEVYNPLFRFVSKFIMGQDATLKRYAASIDNSFRR